LFNKTRTQLSAASKNIGVAAKIYCMLRHSNKPIPESYSVQLAQHLHENKVGYTLAVALSRFMVCRHADALHTMLTDLYHSPLDNL